MNNLATDGLSVASVRWLDRYHRFATLLTLGIFLLALLWTLFSIGGEKSTALFSNTTFTLSALLASFWAFQVVYWGRAGSLSLAPRYQWAWLLIGLGLLANSFGGAASIHLSLIRRVISPSYSDIFFNLSYLLILTGLLLLPSMQFRLRPALDALLTMLCFMGLSWFAIIGPTYFLNLDTLTSPAAFLKMGLSLSYPLWDMLLVLAGVLLLKSRVEVTQHTALFLTGLGIGAIIWSDSALAYHMLFSPNQSQGVFLIEPFRCLGSLLIGLSSLYQYTAWQQKAYHERYSRELTRPLERVLRRNGLFQDGWNKFQQLLVYGPFTALVLITFYSNVILKNHDIGYYLLVLIAVVGVLFAIRYLLAAHESEVISHERAQRHAESERLRHMSMELNALLKMDLLLERVVSMAISGFDFDVVMLLLLEDYEGSLESPPQLLIYAMTSSSEHTSSWRSYGNNILSRTVLSRSVTEIKWGNIPTVPGSWQQSLSINSMTLFPVIYQGNLLGCLGVAREVSPPLNEHDMSTVAAYAEQVATLIEHSRLYQEAREHEEFARAMTNIAARLNAAALEPRELNDLICTEAAHALNVDYALLYLVNDQKKLFLSACYLNDQEVGNTLKDWQELYLLDEDEALHYLQSVLIPIPPDLSAQRFLKQISSDTRSKSLPPFQAEKMLYYKLSKRFAHTAILTPLIVKGEPLGLLIFARSIPPGTRDRRPLTTQDLSHAQDFVEQASVAFTNARLYTHLHDAHQRLKELDRMKDQFMTTASHELRTPLTAVQGYIELMVQYEDILSQERQHEFLLKAQRGCDELVLMLNNIMDASHLEAEAGIKTIVATKVSVQEIIESVLLIIEPQMKQEERELQLDIPAGLIVEADALRLRQVLMNISVNALKYSNHRTPITFSARCLCDKEPSVVISISDKGKGIPVSDQAHLFQRFYRLERDVNSPIRGSGLGLYISRRLVEAMNGKIWIESTGIPGEGSTFHIQLPAIHSGDKTSFV